MALDIDIQFKDQEGNNIQGSCEQAGREGMSLVNAFEHTVQRPIDATSGKSTGRRQHGPVRIWKEIDKASPILAQALYDGIRLKSATIRFWYAAPDGTENNYYTCQLQGVRIQGHTVKQLHNRFDSGKDMGTEAYDVFDLVYENIMYTYMDGGITARDEWLGAKRS
ncbi:MAG: type VI secretion system tube protein Hcp [Schleiferiaceae bacterium]|jgi:type VI secretion system secreted protein Hcp|nr:type VI secretion system tube protein Hcp [Schleiferiaceae bacterium]